MERACAVADVHGAPDAPLPSDRRRVGSADVARRPSFASRNDPVAEAPIALGLEHVWLVAPSVLLSASIGVLLGVLTHRSATARSAVIAVTGAFLTIPSFALLLLLLGIVNLGTAPVVIALTMYGLLPVVRDTITGLRQVDPAIVESALGVGLFRRQRLLSIEVHRAAPGLARRAGCPTTDRGSSRRTP